MTDHRPDLAQPAFAGDAGDADPRLAATLQAFAAGGSPRDVVAALASSRLLVPVVAVLDDEQVAQSELSSPAGPNQSVSLRQEKDSHMASVTLLNPDGRRGLLAFTGLAALRAWRPDARPVPVSATSAARAALQEGIDALVLDVAGPVAFPVEGSALLALAESKEWPLPHNDQDLTAALALVMKGFDDIRAYELLDGSDYGCDLLVRIAPVQGTDPVEVAGRVSAGISRLPVIVATCARGIVVGLAVDE
jgi:hypothetical protein